MSVWFRVDASQHIGVGHLMRSLALAQAMDEQGVDITFVVRAETHPLCLSRHDWVGKIIIIPQHIPMHQEPKWLSELDSFQSAEVLVLDGYQFDAKYREQIRQLPPRFVVFDDTNDSGELFADVVINTTDEALNLGYEITAPDADCCLGAQFRILRREFMVLPSNRWEQRHSLSIVMGGSDVKNVTIALLKGLEVVSFEGPVRVMTGAAYPHHDELTNFLGQTSLAVQHLPNCQQVAETFCSSRLVISAAGSSQFELLACSTPAILLIVANNQIPATNDAVNQKWCTSINIQNDLNVEALVSQLIELWNDDARLREMSDKAGKIADNNLTNGQALLEVIFKGG